MTAKSSRTLAIAAIAAVCAAFFILYSFLPLAAPARFNSPDETSNAFFTRLVAEKSVLWIAEPLNFVTDGLVHPRSVKVVDNHLVPGGFVGLPVLYGSIAKVLGECVVPLLTPFFAVLAALAWALLLSKRFGGRIGIASGALLLAQPAWWYAASRTMQPNVLFVSLVIFSACLFFVAPVQAAIERRKLEGLRLLRLTDAALAGILFGLAVAVRMSEAYWLALGAAVLIALAWPRLPWAKLAAFAVTAAFTILPLLIINNAVYGEPFATGYGSGVSVPAGVLPHGGGDRLLGPLRPLLFPLGFAPRTALVNFWTYGVAFFWWWSVLVVCAGLAYAASMRRAKQKWSRDAAAFGVLALTVTVWLVLFYGSWTVRDNPDPEAVTIGSSYLRYWLPLFVLSTLPVAWLAVTAAERAFAKRRSLAAGVFIACVALTSASDVFWAPGEGLIAVRAALQRYDLIVARIVQLTPENSLVVADSADKYIFPDRPVMTPLRSETNYAALKVLKRHASVYYFGITFPDTDLAWLHDEKLPPLGLTIAPVEAFGEETLYKLSSTDSRDPK